MTEELENIPAFPCAAFGPSDGLIHQTGMTIRDWFAGMALQGIISSPANILKQGVKADYSQKDIAWMAFLLADAMLKARGE